MQSCSGENERYKWVVLVAACFSQMLRAGFIAGTLSLFSIYYVERYSDRTLSSSIGAIQISTASICAFPAILLNKKIGERWSQIIGGLFTASGMAATAFTTQAWQGILGNGALSGLGAAFLSAATYSVLSKYFPGSQLAPYAAITVCQNIGVLATPQLVGSAMVCLGFTKAFLICAGAMSLNVLTGLLFLPKEFEDSVSETVVRRKSDNVISLKIIGRRQGVYNLSSVFKSESAASGITNDLHDLDMVKKGNKTSGCDKLKALGIATNCSTKKELSRTVSVAKLVNELVDPQETASRAEAKDLGETDSENLQFSGPMSEEPISFSDTSSDTFSESTETSERGLKKSPSVYELVKSSRGVSIANMVDCSELVKQSAKQVFKTKTALNFLLTSFITTGGYVAYNSIVGDFSKTSLKLTDQQYVLGLTILGITQLLTGIIYLLITRFFNFCSSLMYVVSIMGASAVTFSLLSHPTVETFHILMAISGFFKSLYIASTFAAGMEVTSPTQAVFMFMMVNFVEGVGGIVFPYVSSYLQVQVNLSAGLYLAGGVQLLGALSLLPLSIKFLVMPKDYTKHKDFIERVEQIGYEPNRPF